MKRKLLSVLLMLCLAFSLLPTAALAEGENVAKVGDTEYTTLQAAIDAASRKATVTLLADTRENVTIGTPYVTLDLNGHTLNGSTGERKPALTITARVTVKDSSEAQTGTIMREDTAENSGVSSHYVIDVQGGGWLTFESGTVKNDSGAGGTKGASLVRVGDDSVAKYPGLNIKGGTFTQNNFIVIKVDRGDLFLNGGTLNSANSYAIEDWHRATIKGGTVNGTAAAWTYSGAFNSTLTVEDGTINGDVLSVNYGNADKVAKVEIAGGTVTGELDTRSYDPTTGNLTSITDAAKSTIKVTGGTFSSDPTKYVVEDSAVTKNEDNTFGVAKAYLAKVGETSYYTLPEAVAAAQNGETVTLLKNVTENVTIPASKTITLDLDGKKLTVPADVGIRVKGKLTVTGNGTVTCADTPFMVDAGELVIENGTVNSDSNYGIYAKDGGSVTVNGGTLTSLYSPLTGNNTTGNMNFTVNGGTLTAKNGPAIYMPGQVSLTITDGVLNGGISLRMGQVNISGGTINAITTSIGMPTDIVDGKPVYAYSGNVWFPDALYVIGGTYTSTDATYGNSLKMNITGGTFNCANDKGSAVAIYDLGKVEQAMNVKISGAANLATKSTERSAYQVVSFADMKAIPIEGFGKTELVGKVSTTITGGLFSSDPSAYCAEGKTGVASGNSQYPYTVGDKDANAKPAHVDTATVPAKTTSNDDTVKNVASEITGANVTNNAAEAATKDLANKNKLTGGSALENTTVVDKLNGVTGANNTAADVAIVYQTYVDVTVTDAKKNETGVTEITVNLTPMYRVVATTSDVVNRDQEIIVEGDTGVNAVVIQEGKKLDLGDHEYEVKLALPDGFAAAGNKLSIKHTKGNGTVEYYTGTVSEESSKLYVTFTTKGFSPFTISAPAASIGETMYPTLAEAIAKAANGNTIKLEKNCTESVTVSGKSLTINKNNHEYDFAKVTVDSNSTKTENGDTLTITYTAPSSSSGSSGYYVSAPSKTENGSVTVSPRYADKGDTVTVTVKPDSGYVLETLTVTDKNGNELTLKDKGNGKYTFTMPAGKVEVKATFMEDNSMLNFFYDVPNGAYFYEAVKWAVKNGITTGVGNDLFAPEQPCTRAQIVTFLWRAAGSPEPKGAASGMTDVVSGSYYEKAVAWAIENGITTGTTTTTFSPDATCTRAQAVTFLARALNAKAASAAEFSDVPTDSYFADAVAWAAANGVTEGIGGGLFAPDNDCTRGQIVTFLYRAYNK